VRHKQLIFSHPLGGGGAWCDDFGYDHNIYLTIPVSECVGLHDSGLSSDDNWIPDCKQPMF